MDDEKVIFCGNDERYLDKELIENSDNTNGGTAFRIPSLIKAEDTLIAVIDKQSSGDGWGFIELAVRRSTDGGETWSDIETIAAPPARETKVTNECYASAFFINPCMAIAPNGDVVMLVEFYPECRSFNNQKLVDKKKIPYSMYKNKMYPVIYDRNGKFYLITENGVILDYKYRETEYRVTDWKGSLYRGEEYLGNIFLNGKTGNGGPDDITTFGAPLKAPKRNYIYMIKSSDKGATWSEPVDVTGDFHTAEDGPFINVAPGVGLTTADGRIVMPLYVDGKESISVYSIDDGETWHRMASQPYSCNTDEWQMVQASDGTVLGLGRQKSYGKTPLSISTSNGKRWEKAGTTDLYSPKCQKSVINIGSYVFCSHASEKTRANGVITIGRFKRTKGKATNIDWLSEVEINQGFFGYSCLSQIDEDSVGVLYEAAPSSYICFKKFKLEDLIR